GEHIRRCNGLSSAPVFVLLSDDVDVIIPGGRESDFHAARLVRPASIRVDAYPDRTFEGTIAIIAPELDPASRTVRVSIHPQDEAGELAPGMFASVELLN
ncbi:MAG: efflux RND transporter periplasmic adaptor subunit, partial [Caldilineaceae bacterium]|nr:efflux RND transporter periplasmic adaptor subunit [Caldilineaceae bacterium]